MIQLFQVDIGQSFYVNLLLKVYKNVLTDECLAKGDFTTETMA